ncbi:MAG: hypothetical protein PHR82_07515 [Endomicrobiaceae bacterium]|nr:hypothetical protein [Endomicrobiaceae bacterium]
MFKKIFLIFLGITLSLVFLELFLQSTSFVIKNIKNYKTNQELKKKDSITILCIGESTTDGQWPIFLEEALKARGVTKKIKVIDEGHGASNTDKLLTEVIYAKLNIYNPDIIVSMIGINDRIDIVRNIKHLRSKVVALMLLIIEHLKVKSLYADTVTDKRDFDLNLEKAEKLFHERKYQEAVKIYEYLNKKYPNKKLNFIHEWIINYKSMNDTKKIELIVLETIKEYPYFDVYETIEILCITKNIKVLKQLFPIDKPEILKPIIENNIGEFLKLRENLVALKMTDLVNVIDKFIYDISSDRAIAESQYKYFPNLLGFKAFSDFIQADYKKADDGFKIETDYLLTHIVLNTENNYKKLAQLCKDRQIKLIAMQYPVRSVKPLQNILKDFNNIIFVSNEKNFKERLKTTNYKMIFKDLFAGDFGHCTDLGNQMIADNLADTLVKLIN